MISSLKSLILGSVLTMVLVSPAMAAKTPHQVLGLSRWKLTIPYDGSDSDKLADEIYQSATRTKEKHKLDYSLSTYSNSKWFWTLSGDIWVAFRCEAKAPKTSGTKNARCELREMDTSSKEVYWSMKTTTIYGMEGRCRVTALPSSNKTCFAQIHAKSKTYDDIIRLQVRKSGSNYVLHVQGSCVSDNDDDVSTIASTAEIRYKIEAGRNKVKLFLNGSTTPTRTYNNSKTNSPENYFKAGNYLQSKPKSGAGQVEYRSLVLSSRTDSNF